MHRLAEGTRKAAAAWGLNLLVKDKRWNSDSLTVIEVPEVRSRPAQLSAALLVQAAGRTKSHWHTQSLAVHCAVYLISLFVVLEYTSAKSEHGFIGMNCSAWPEETSGWACRVWTAG